MPNRFCAICGKNINKDAPHFGMCLGCYLKENPLFILPAKYSFKSCVECRSYSKNEGWVIPKDDDIFATTQEILTKDLLKTYISKQNLEFTFYVREESFEYSSRHLLKGFILEITGYNIDQPKFKSKQSIKINLENSLCKNCSNLLGGMFFLAIIQLRVIDEKQYNFLGNVIDDIHKFVEKVFEKDPKHYISNIEDQKNGVDLYLSSNEIMNKIISYLRGKYHFMLKRTKKLVGRDHQRGKNLYRLKSLIKFLPFDKKDIILIENKKFSIESIHKNRIHLRAEDGTKIIKSFSYFFMEKVFILENKEGG
ncbi:MAG: NMD3-related protein [Promethearchaeota archaeon]